MKKFKLSTLLKLYYRLAVISGVCPYIFDSRNQCVRSSNWLGAYSFLLHASWICLVGPFMILMVENNDMDQMVVTNLSNILEFVNVAIKVSSIALSMILYFKNRPKCVKSINEILRLNATTFQVELGSEDERIHFWFIRNVCLKVAVTTVLGWLHAGMFFENFRTLSWRLIGLLFCKAGIFTFQQFGMIYLFIGVGFLCKFYEMNNLKLRYHYECYKKISSSIKINGAGMEKCCQLSDHIDDTCFHYKELFDLHQFIRHLYGFQIISTVISGLFNNVRYWFDTYTIYFSEPFNLIVYLSYFAFTIGLYLDNYLMCAVCQKGASLWRESRDILGKFSLHKSVDSRFDRSMEVGHLQIANQRISYGIYGMFSIDLNFFYIYMAFSCSSVIILMQFDFKERW